MGDLNLDALIAAREEALGESPEPKTITWCGVEYPCPDHPSIELVLSAVEGNLRVTLRELLGDEGYAAFMATSPPWSAFDAIADGLGDLYPEMAGKVRSSSGKSSRRTGASSRATSNGSTPSTSGKPVSGKKH